VRAVADTSLTFSMTQTGGRLPVHGEYEDYPFVGTLKYGAVAVFEVP